MIIPEFKRGRVPQLITRRVDACSPVVPGQLVDVLYWSGALSQSRISPALHAVTCAETLMGEGNWLLRHLRHKVDALNGTTPEAIRVWSLIRALSGNWSKSICFTVIPHGFCCNAATLVKVYVMIERNSVTQPLASHFGFSECPIEGFERHWWEHFLVAPCSFFLVLELGVVLLVMLLCLRNRFNFFSLGRSSTQGAISGHGYRGDPCFCCNLLIYCYVNVSVSCMI